MTEHYKQQAIIDGWSKQLSAVDLYAIMKSSNNQLLISSVYMTFGLPAANILPSLLSQPLSHVVRSASFLRNYPHIAGLDD